MSNYPISLTSKSEKFPSVAIHLEGRPSDSLNWSHALDIAKNEREKGKKLFWIFDLGLERDLFPLNDPLYYGSLQLALKTFTAEIWPLYREESIGLCFYRGKAQGEEFCTYCQMLSSHLPDEMPITLLFQGSFTGIEKAQLLSIYEHFQVMFQEGGGLIWDDEKISYVPQTQIALCVPDESSLEIEQAIARLKFSYRVIPERFLNESWNEVDYLYVFSRWLSPRGKRMLQGFCAAGGTVIVEGEKIGLESEIGAEGFEPPAYWSQTSRASQAALYPVE